MHLAATRRAPVFQHFANNFMGHLWNEGVAFGVIFDGGEQADIPGEFSPGRNEVVHCDAEGKVQRSEGFSSLKILVPVCARECENFALPARELCRDQFRLMPGFAFIGKRFPDGGRRRRSS